MIVHENEYISSGERLPWLPGEGAQKAGLAAIVAARRASGGFSA